MEFIFHFGILVFLAFCFTVSLSDFVEDRPCSRFDCEHRLLESLVRLEHSHAAMREELENLKANASQNRSDKNQASTGGSYVRWGRTICPANAKTIYAGYAGGSLHTDTGAAANHLCLPEDPQWSEKTIMDNTLGTHGARVYGAEYQMEGGNENFFDGSIHQDDVPCAVCETERSKILMIPGRTTCYDDWTVEYSGFLSSGHYSHPAASEFVCLDETPEVLSGGKENQNGKLFYLSEARCGSLPCPPYVNGRILSCVVCSK